MVLAVMIFDEMSNPNVDSRSGVNWSASTQTVTRTEPPGTLAIVGSDVDGALQPVQLPAVLVPEPGAPVQFEFDVMYSSMTWQLE